MEIIWNQTSPQTKAWKYLLDKVTREVLFGGGAGGGKSMLGCAWLIIMCMSYPGSKWLMGRSELKSLRLTTFASFMDLCKEWGLKINEHYKVDLQQNVITFLNGSKIIMKDLKYYPSKDPNFDSLGSLEITGAFIDEANQVLERCKDIVRSRCRYKLDEFGLIPKVLYTCNPAKNWTYKEFYHPWRKKQLEDRKAFIQALAKDNKYLSKHYIEELKSLKGAQKERLYFGNWEYDDDPTRLFEYEHLQRMFSISVNDVKRQSYNYYIVADIARLGNDKTVITVWYGLELLKIVKIDKSTLDVVCDRIHSLSTFYSVPRNRILVDEDGVGGGVVDMLKCRGFVNNAKPKGNNNYQNIKTQCYFTLKTLVEQGRIAIKTRDYMEEIIEELSQIKEADVDKDGKVKLMKKSDLIESLGRSPDFADALMMRMLFELGSNKSLSLSSVNSYNVDKTVFGDIYQTQF
jgi:phage terminase large subunit